MNDSSNFLSCHFHFEIYLTWNFDRINYLNVNLFEKILWFTDLINDEQLFFMIVSEWNKYSVLAQRILSIENNLAMCLYMHIYHIDPSESESKKDQTEEVWRGCRILIQVGDPEGRYVLSQSCSVKLREI